MHRFHRLLHLLKSLLNFITTGYGWWDMVIYPVYACFFIWYVRGLPGFYYQLYPVVAYLLMIRAAYSSLVYFPWKTKYSSIPYALCEVVVLRLSVYAAEEVVAPMILGSGLDGQRAGIFVFTLLDPRIKAATLILLYAVVVNVWRYFWNNSRRSSGECANSQHRQPTQYKSSGGSSE